MIRTLFVCSALLLFQGTCFSLDIVTVIFPAYDFARTVGGDKVNVRQLLKPGMESHSFEPTPADLKAISNADLFIITGGENETWLERILLALDGRVPPLLRLTEVVPVVNEELVEGMQAEAEEGEEAEADEHVWTTPSNALLITRAISAQMQRLDPDNAEYYAHNEKNYCQQLERLDAELFAAVQHAPRKTIVFGDRFPFRYLADRYGLSYFAAFPGCATETEASPATLAFLIKKVRAENIPIVFSLELSDNKIADAICEATGAQRRMLHSCHNRTMEETRSDETYLSLMRRNIAALSQALQ